MARNIKVIEKQLKLKIAVSKSAGKVKPISAKEMDFSPFGIGLEKADGGFYDPSAAYGAIGELLHPGGGIRAHIIAILRGHLINCIIDPVKIWVDYYVLYRVLRLFTLLKACLYF